MTAKESKAEVYELREFYQRQSRFGFFEVIKSHSWENL